MIRLGRTEDLNLIRQLNDRLIGNELTPRQLYRTAWWLAEASDGGTAGFCGVKYDGGDWVYLIRAAVDDRYRGRGLQLRMIRTRLAWARRTTRATLAVTDTLPENVASNNNLIRCHFMQYLPAYAWAGYDGVVYWRREL